MPIPVPPFAVINVPPNVNVPDDVIGAETSGVSVSPVPPPPPEIAVTVPLGTAAHVASPLKNFS